MRTAGRTVAVLCAVVFFPGPARGDEPDPTKGPAELQSLKYRLVGPAIGGRVSRVAGVPGDPLTYYAATASGGVWKSVDGGLRFKPVFDDQPISSIGSIAVAPSDPNVVYVGSGEANIRGDVAAGDGIYKSVDGGKTWSHVWKQEGQIGTMIVHPGNPDVAFAAVLGHAFGPNPERGVYRTRDGGKTWQRVLAKDADTGASDVSFDPSNPNILFAGLWQARRRPWELTSGGPGSGLYTSRDGGDTWKPLKEKGLPEGIWGKIGVAVAPSDGSRVYALIEAEKGGLVRSDDGGESWTLVNPHRSLRQRAWYYSTMTVDPRSADVVWFPQVPLLRTLDGGKTIKRLKDAPHGDYHDVWVDPQNPRRLIAGHDGGVSVSVNGGETWHSPPLPIAQLYHVAADNQIPYRVSGAMQDFGTASGPSNSLSSDGIDAGDWHEVGGGEAGHIAHDPANSDVAYAGEYGGYISRYDHRTRQARHVGIYPENTSGHGPEDMRYRFQWTAPILISPHDPRVVYHGGNVLLRTTDAGMTWTPISPDLTRNDKSRQRWSGGPITGDNTGAEHYCTVFAVAESSKEKGLIWVGTDDGLVQVTRDGGASWTNVTSAIPKMPEWGTVSLIEPSPFEAGTAYVVVDAHRLDDSHPYLFKTTDHGKTWKSLAARLPQDVYLHAVREDPRRKGLLYLGTERGVAFSTDDGGTWQPLKLNLPTVAVHDLVVKGDDLVVATHGRSIWILDDLTPIRELSPPIAERAVHLFPTRPAIRWRYHSGFHAKGTGENPLRGATLHYFFKKKPAGDVTLEILDAQGATVNALSSRKPEPPEEAEDDPDAPEPRKKTVVSLEPGVQRVVWDLTYAGAARIRKAKVDAGDPDVGPLVLPGTYTARLTAEGQTLTTTIEVRPDPRATVAPAELAEGLTFALRIRDDLSRIAGIVHRLRSVREQIRSHGQALTGSTRAPAWIKSSQELIARCDGLEQKLHNPHAEVVYDILAQKGGARLYSRLSALFEWAKEADAAPTQGMREVHADQTRELEAYEAEWKDLTAAGLAALNQMARELDIPHISVPEDSAPR